MSIPGRSNGRLDWKALGYAGDPRKNRRPKGSLKRPGDFGRLVPFLGMAL